MTSNTYEPHMISNSLITSATEHQNSKPEVFIAT